METLDGGMPAYDVPEYAGVKDRVADYVAATIRAAPAARAYHRFNTEEAHLADDYGEPQTPLQLAARASNAAYWSSLVASDNLLVTCAWLVLTDERLLRKLVSVFENNQRLERVSTPIMAEVSGSDDTPPEMNSGQRVHAARTLLSGLPELSAAVRQLDLWFGQYQDEWRAWRARKASRTTSAVPGR